MTDKDAFSEQDDGYCALFADARIETQKDEAVVALDEQMKPMSAEPIEAKKGSASERMFNTGEISECKTRKLSIDADLRMAGWDLDRDVIEEYEVHGILVKPGNSTGQGFVGHLLLGRDGKPCAILEAKRTMCSLQKGVRGTGEDLHPGARDGTGL